MNTELILDESTITSCVYNMSNSVQWDDKQIIIRSKLQPHVIYEILHMMPKSITNIIHEYYKNEIIILYIIRIMDENNNAYVELLLKSMTIDNTFHKIHMALRARRQNITINQYTILIQKTPEDDVVIKLQHNPTSTRKYITSQDIIDKYPETTNILLEVINKILYGMYQCLH